MWIKRGIYDRNDLDVSIDRVTKPKNFEKKYFERNSSINRNLKDRGRTDGRSRDMFL